MSTLPHDPAFPLVTQDAEGALTTPTDGRHHGLTKREHFAALAMQSLILWRGQGDEQITSDEDIVKCSVSMSDALVAELNRTEK